MSLTSVKSGFARLAVCGFAIAALALSGCGTVSKEDGSAASSKTQSAASAASTKTAEPAKKYAITDEQIVKDGYTAKVTGTFTNNSGTEMSYVQVSYTLFDESGAQVGTALANTNNLADGGTWKFEALATATPDKIASFKLGDVTGF